MKQLLLFRHAKSSWDDARLKDFDRPLAPRGKKDAAIMGNFLKRVKYLPGSVLSSPAQRAKETTLLFIKAAGLKNEIINWNEDLYHGNPSDYLEAITEVPPDINRLMLVGHNPEIEEVIDVLCGGAHVRMSTAAIICFEQSINRWEELENGLMQLKWLMIPKMVKQFL